MKAIGVLPNLRATQAFTDYLKVQRLSFEVRVTDQEHPEQEGPVQEGKEQYVIFVPEEVADDARAIYLDFVAHPSDEKFLQASWQISEPSNQRLSFGLGSIVAGIGPLTKFVTGLCVIIFAFSYFGFYREIFGALHFDLSWSQPYRIVTPAIMHLSLLHITFNLAWWWYLGGRVEKVLGAKTLIAIFIASAALSNTLQAFIESPNFAGLSGVNYALAGFAWGCGVFHQSKTIHLPNNLFMFLLVWMIVGFFDVLPINMANWAHLGGLVAGLLLSLVLVKKEQ